MTRTITNGTKTKRTGIFAVMAMALGMLFLLACRNQPDPNGGEGPSSANQTILGAELAGLLSGQGSPALRTGLSGSSNGKSGVWVSGTGEASTRPTLPFSAWAWKPWQKPSASLVPRPPGQWRQPSLCCKNKAWH